MSNSIIGIHINNNNNNINNNNSHDNDDYDKFNSNPSICMSKWNQFLSACGALVWEWRTWLFSREI